MSFRIFFTVVIAFFIDCSIVPLWAEQPSNHFTIQGSVVDTEGHPVPHARVCPMSFSRLDQKYHGMTDENGRFTLSTDGKMIRSLLVENDDSSLMGTFLLDKPTEPGGEIRIVLSPSRTIKGTVVGADRGPIADAVVFAVSDHAEISRTNTDTEGRFQFRFPSGIKMAAVVALKRDVGFDYIWTMESPADNEYSLFGREGDPTRRRTTDGPFSLKLEGVQPIRIKVVAEDEKPIEGIEVHPWYFTKPDQPNDLNIATDLYFRKSDHEGTVVFDFIPKWQETGLTFWLGEDSAEVRRTMTCSFLPERINLQPGQFETEQTVTMKRAVSVGGTVRFPNGQPAVGWLLRAQGAPDQFEQCHTDRQGRYVVPVIPQSRINLSVEKPLGYWGTSLEKDWVARAKRDIDVDAEPVVMEDFVLEKGIRVSGRVTGGDDRQPADQGSILINPLTSEEATDEELSNWIPCWWWAMIKDGDYEFWAVPGDYRLQCQYGRGDRIERIKLEPGQELTVDFHVELRQRDRKKVDFLRGKVLTDEDPPRPVAGALIRCRTFDHDFSRSYEQGFRTDENGDFEIPVGTMSVYIQAMTPDGKQGVIAKVSPKEENLVLVPKPLGVITGKLIHHDTQEPVVGRRIECAIRINDETPGNTYTTSGFPRQTVTDENGVYRFAGVPCGCTYNISLTQRPRSEPDETNAGSVYYENLGNADPKPGATADLGTFAFKPHISGSSEYLWNFYNAWSQYRDKNTFEDRFKLLLERCRRDGKNLLVVFAATESVEGDVLSEANASLARNLCDLMYDNSDVFQYADRFYLMGVRTDAKVQYGDSRRGEALKFARRHGIPEESLDRMTLCFFAADGTLLAAEPIDGITSYGLDGSGNRPGIEFQKDAVVKLLKQYAPGVSAETPEQFKDRLTEMGDRLIRESRAVFANDNLSENDFNTAFEKGVWGVGFRYGFRQEEYLKEMEAFLRSLKKHLQSDRLGVGHHWTNLMHRHRKWIQEQEPSQHREAFHRFCEKYAAIAGEFPLQNDFERSVFRMTVIQSAEALDPDASLGLVRFAAETFKMSLDDPDENEPFSVKGFLRRAYAPGKPLRFFGLNPDLTPFDIKDMQGKTVLVLFCYRLTDEQKHCLRQLRDALKEEAFEIINYVPYSEVSYSGSLAEQKEQWADFPGRIVFSTPLEPQLMGGMGKRKQDDDNLNVYYATWSINSLDYKDSYISFLVGVDGKTLRTDSRGLHSSLMTRLKELFPKKSEPLTALETACRSREQAETDAARRLLAYKESGTVQGELAAFFDCLDGDVGFMENFYLSYTSYPFYRDRYFALRDFPDLDGLPSEELRYRILRRKFDALHYEGAWRLQNDPTLRPEDVFKEIEGQIRDLRRANPDHPYAYDIHAVRRGIIHWNEVEFLKSLPSKEQPKYAAYVAEKYVDLVRDVSPMPGTPIGQDYRIITPELIKEFHEIDLEHKTTLVRDLCLELAPLFGRSDDEKMHEYAAELLEQAIDKR